jgi:hypothetical protein
MEIMMAITVKQQEGTPSSYPAITGLSTAAAAILAVAWQRVESYIAHRYTSRSIAWTVEGPGEWLPPLAPATIATIEIWANGEWEAVPDVTPSPRGGYWLPGRGFYRVTGTLAAGEAPLPVPAAVSEAVKRLAEYMAQRGKAGARSDRITVGSVGLAVTHDEAWRARAIENSGAGDLLRPYRRVS